MNAQPAASADRLPPYIALQPVEYKGVVLGVERISTVFPELEPLARQEWHEVGDYDRLGEFIPDFASAMRYEMAGQMGVVTVRTLGTWELVGYFVGILSRPLKTKGKLVLSEVGVYLAPNVRTGWLAAKLIDYTEQVARLFGADALIIAHRPEHSRIGVLYQRRGFSPLSVEYIKRLTDDKD